MRRARIFIPCICGILFSITNGLAQELYTHSNAASITNEINAVTGWLDIGATTVSTISENDGSSNFSIAITRGEGGGFNAADATVTGLSNGTQYNIVIRARNDTSNTDNGWFFGWTGIIESTNFYITTNVYQDYTFSITSNGDDFNIRTYACDCSNASNKVYISSISVTPVNSSDTQIPTAPTLSSNGQTDTTVDLSWSGATDNTGVTGYKIFKDGTLEATLGNVSTYQVTGLVASTAYNFTTTALDATGNESAVSNAVSITTNSLGGGPSGGGNSIWSETNSVASYTGDVAVGTGTVPTGYKMAIDGKLITEEVKVQLSGNWPDYVFKEEYDLPTLEEVQKHIKEKGHLPNIPSAKEAEANGVELGEMNKLLLEKVEELTLYILQQQKEIEQLKQKQ